MKRIVKNKGFRKTCLIVLDFIGAFVACYLSLVLLNYEFNQTILYYSLGYSFFSVIVLGVLRLYDGIWKYASVSEFVKIVFSCIILFIINFTFNSIKHYLPTTWTILVTILHFIYAFSTRFIYRLKRYIEKGGLPISNNHQSKERIMIVGSGDAGNNIMKEMINSDKIYMVPICFIDDDPSKLNKYVGNVKVVGNRNDIPKMCSKYSIDTIIIAMPSVSAKEISNIIRICQDTKCKIQTLPGLYQFVNSKALLQTVRNVQVEDLLGRNQIKIDVDEIRGYIAGKVVMVTGGGGSIGSELCRQIASSNPKQLIIVDIYENNAYDIEQELKISYPNLNLVTLIASVRDANKIDTIFEKYHPSIVYHAAAHKHVPLMETSPNEAVKNNIFGTLNVARSADKYGVKRFILISTDKAVNPTNIMGATKRICEMIIQTINKRSNCDFVAVRFGNVLGSNGSVIPLFKRQIENGGPVTVTHKDITRFFMTIPEAVSLVLEAGSFAKGGEIFILDMGDPVKIYDLAVNLIRLSGYTPNVDIDIKIIGLRPGEKLYEEILMKEEGLTSTANKLIHIGKPIELDEDNLFKCLDNLYKKAYQETDEMKKLIKELVPTYHPDDIN